MRPIKVSTWQRHRRWTVPKQKSYLKEAPGMKLKVRQSQGHSLVPVVMAIGTWLLLFSCSVISDSLQPHGLQHSRLPHPSLSPRICSNSCPSRWWYHPTISSFVTSYSSCPQSFPASGSFPMSQFFASGGRRIGASALASVLPMSIRGRFPLGLTGLISLLSKRLSRVFSSTTIWKHQFFSTQPSLWANSHIQTQLLEKP